MKKLKLAMDAYIEENLFAVQDFGKKTVLFKNGQKKIVSTARIIPGLHLVVELDGARFTAEFIERIEVRLD